MESLYSNSIFGSHERTVKIQKSVPSSGAFADVGPLKQRSNSDGSNVFGKKILGDIQNTLKQSNKKNDLQENVFSKIKPGDCTSESCSRTPLLPKPQGIPSTLHKVQHRSGLEDQTPRPSQFLGVPKTVHKLPGLKSKDNSCFKTGPLSLKSSGKYSPVFQDMVLNSPELQGSSPVAEDNYEDIWPTAERPTLEDYARNMEFWNDEQQSVSLEAPPIQFVEDSCLDEVNASLNLSECCELGASLLDPLEEFPEPEMQGPDPFVEDTGEDIWPVSERPGLQDFKRMLVFWDSSRQPLEYDPPSVSDLVEDICIDLDFNLDLPPIEELDLAKIVIPQPTFEII